MEILEGKIATKDGVSLYTRDWLIEKPKAVMVLAHGFGEHINRYNHVADFFNKNGFSVFGYDRRGHGKSEGKRGHTSSHDAIVDEIALVINKAKSEFPNLPVVLYGHSQGGHLVLFHLIKREPNVDAAVVTGPWIQLGFQPPAFKIFIGRMLSKVLPTLSMPNELNHDALARDKSVAKEYAEDPLNVFEITTACGAAMLDNADWLNQYSGEISVPLMINHGGSDPVISPEATKQFAERVTGNITLKIWEDSYHEIHNDLDKEAVFEEILSWIQTKMKFA